MLFNSFPFIFLYLPITALVFYLLGRQSRPLAALWLFSASLFFYGWWNPAYVGLLLASIMFNYGSGLALSRAQAPDRKHTKNALLVGAVAINLSVLAYYKYANFFLDNLGLLLGSTLTIESVILPIGISFYTFTQIAFLVDAYRGHVKEPNLVHYGLFVTYFPHLIAGPVLHHKEMMPQFGKPGTYRINSGNLACGLAIFSIGLFKKTIIADGIASYATPVFQAADHGVTLSFFEAWAGALAYAFQIYYDFSGYSDMAVGLSLMFNVKLPLNFYSPYKARNIIEFWRRWHITLSRFLRDYLYIPLGGNRKGKARRHLNLMATMLLGGLWHGASWNFVVWGLLHGIYLVINHIWQSLLTRMNLRISEARLYPVIAIGLTFVAVCFAWVFFRATSISGATSMAASMLGFHGISLPSGMKDSLPVLGAHVFEFNGMFHNELVNWNTGALWLLCLSILTWFAPNTLQIMRRQQPTIDNFTVQGKIPARIQWSPNLRTALIGALLMLASIINIYIGSYSEFLYFQF